MRRVFGLFVLLAALTAATLVQAGPAQDTLKGCVDDVLSILRSSKQGDPGRTEKLSSALQKVFDADELARRTLGANWQRLSPEEQASFTAAFVKLLEKTYVRRIEAYSDERVDFTGETALGDDRAEVTSKIITSTKEVPITYRLIKKAGWKVYDVVIEGVSLVQNYRNQFAQVLAKETPAQLIERVRNLSKAS